MTVGDQHNVLEYPLVSIVVITFNSEKYILETLESAKTQKYRNVELIISDDCSTDSTIEICEKWIEFNKNFFKNTKLIKALRNSGIPSNVNKGVNAATGEWIKLIAGDDILLDSCIERNLNYIRHNSECNFLFSRPIFFGNNNLDYDRMNAVRKTKTDFYQLTARYQFLHLLIRSYPMSPPTIFFNRKVLTQLGGFDERFPNEDFPLYLKVTKAGHKLHFISERTVKYRYHDTSISFRKNDEAINFWKRLKFRKTVKQYITWDLFKKHPLIVIDYYNQFLINEIVIKLGNTIKIRNILKPFRFLSPLYVKEKITGKVYILFSFV